MPLRMPKPFPISPKRLLVSCVFLIYLTRLLELVYSPPLIQVVVWAIGAPLILCEAIRFYSLRAGVDMVGDGKETSAPLAEDQESHHCACCRHVSSPAVWAWREEVERSEFEDFHFDFPSPVGEHTADSDHDIPGHESFANNLLNSRPPHSVNLDSDSSISVDVTRESQMKQTIPCKPQNANDSGFCRSKSCPFLFSSPHPTSSTTLESNDDCPSRSLAHCSLSEQDFGQKRDIFNSDDLLNRRTEDPYLNAESAPPTGLWLSCDRAIKSTISKDYSWLWSVANRGQLGSSDSKRNMSQQPALWTRDQASNQGEPTAPQQQSRKKPLQFPDAGNMTKPELTLSVDGSMEQDGQLDGLTVGNEATETPLYGQPKPCSKILSSLDKMRSSFSRTYSGQRNAGRLLSKLPPTPRHRKLARNRNKSKGGNQREVRYNIDSNRPPSANSARALPNLANLWTGFLRFTPGPWQRGSQFSKSGFNNHQEVDQGNAEPPLVFPPRPIVDCPLQTTTAVNVPQREYNRIEEGEIARNKPMINWANSDIQTPASEGRMISESGNSQEWKDECEKILNSIGTEGRFPRGPGTESKLPSLSESLVAAERFIRS